MFVDPMKQNNADFPDLLAGVTATAPGYGFCINLSRDSLDPPSCEGKAPKTRTLTRTGIWRRANSVAIAVLRCSIPAFETPYANCKYASQQNGSKKGLSSRNTDDVEGQFGVRHTTGYINDTTSLPHAPLTRPTLK